MEENDEYNEEVISFKTLFLLSLLMIFLTLGKVIIFEQEIAEALDDIISLLGILVPFSSILCIKLYTILMMKRLIKGKLLVKKYEIIDYLAYATCICTDKTGTLTYNKMEI